MKKFSLVIVAILAFSLVVGCGGQSTAESSAAGQSGAAASAPASNQFITVATGGTSGVYYPVGGAFSSVIQNRVGLRSSAQTTGASVENINLILSDRAEMAIMMGDAVTQAYQGFGAFEGQEPKEELRGLMSLYPNYVQLVAMANSGIETFYDLRGKRVGVGAPNSGVELNARLMFEAHGMTYDDVRQDFLMYGEAVDQMRNGMIDAAFVTSGIPNGTVMDLGATNEIRIIPIEGDGMAYLRENYPFFTANVIPAGTYNNTEDIPTATIMNLMLVRHDLPEDTVYNIVAGVFDNLETIHNSHNAARNITLENVMNGMIVPLHPGAERFYREMGAID